MKKVSYSELLQERDMEIPKKKKKKICDSDDSDSDKAGTSLPKLTSFSKTVDKVSTICDDFDMLGIVCLRVSYSVFLSCGVGVAGAGRR